MKSPNSSGLTILFRGAEVASEPVYLTQNRIFIMPTRYGLMFIGIFLALTFGAVNYNNNLGYLIAFSLSSLAVMSLIHTYRNLAGLVISPGKSQPVFAGQKALFGIIIKNNHDRVRQLISLASQEGSSLVGLMAKENKEVFIQSQTKSRGLIKCPQATISSVYPLGLFRSLTRVRPDVTCLVYPRPYSGQDTSRASTDADKGANTAQSTIPGVEEFYDFKTYEYGESYKKIDWKAYARGHGLLSKQFADPDSQLAWFDLDDFSGFDLETSLSILTRLILDARQGQLTYGLKLPSQRIEPSSGLDHMHNCLRALALYEA